MSAILRPEPCTPSGVQGSVAEFVLCDIGDGGTPFVRKYLQDSTGMVTSVVDFDLNGDPYVVLGPVGNCVTSSGGGGGSSDYGTTTVAAGENILAGHVVARDNVGLGYMPSSSDLDDAMRIVGVAMTAGLVGEAVVVQFDGLLTTSGLTPGFVYLGLDGELTSMLPASGFQVQIGSAISTTALVIRPQLPIYL